MNRFTPAEDDYIRANYLTMKVNDIANHLGRSRSVVGKHLKVLGLQIPADVRRARMPTTKGLKPHNISKVGTQRKHTGYLYECISPGKFKLKHVMVWEAEHGPIDKGSVLIFRDGNPLNCELSNLELISRKELIARNGVQNYPIELQQIIRLKGALTLRIRKKQKHGKQ